MAEPFIGEIRLFTFNFAPQNWAKCDGQLLQINQNAALYSLLGVRFGGNPSANFNLPDLRGRTPICMGQGGASLTAYNIGDKGGAETVALAADQTPHYHVAGVVTALGDKGGPTGRFIASAPTGINMYLNNMGTTTAMTALHPDTVGSAGGGQGHPNMQPFLALNFCIALLGVYPPRN